VPQQSSHPLLPHTHMGFIPSLATKTLNLKPTKIYQLVDYVKSFIVVTNLILVIVSSLG
jgi:hypothetical protein